MRNGQFQGSGPSFGKNQFGGGNEWNNKEQGQKTGQLDGNIQLQGFFQFYGSIGEFQQPSQSGNKQQFPGGNQPGNNGKFPGIHQPSQGLKPSDDNNTKGHGRPQHGFNFPTGMPGHFGDITHEPGSFDHPKFGHGHQQTSTPSGKHQFHIL
jgi:hypothetical protein